MLYGLFIIIVMILIIEIIKVNETCMINFLIRALYRLIRPRRKFPMTLTFKKEDGKWYIDLPSYPGPKEALQMVCGADTLCDMLSENKSTLRLLLSDTAYGRQHRSLEFIQTDDAGAWYNFISHKEDEHTFPLWLCDVTLYVIGYFPERIYFKVL